MGYNPEHMFGLKESAPKRKRVNAGKAITKVAVSATRGSEQHFVMCANADEARAVQAVLTSDGWYATVDDRPKAKSQKPTSWGPVFNAPRIYA